MALLPATASIGSQVDFGKGSKWGSANASTKTGDASNWYGGLSTYGADANWTGFSAAQGGKATDFSSKHNGDIKGGLAYLDSGHTTAVDANGTVYIQMTTDSGDKVWQAYNSADSYTQGTGDGVGHSVLSGDINVEAQHGAINDHNAGVVAFSAGNGGLFGKGNGEDYADNKSKSQLAQLQAAKDAYALTGAFVPPTVPTATVDAPDNTVANAASGVAGAVSAYHDLVINGLKDDATGAFGADKAFQGDFDKSMGALQSAGTETAKSAGVNAAGTMTGEAAANLTATGIEQKGLLDRKAQSAYQDLVTSSINAEVGNLTALDNMDVAQQTQVLQQAATTFAQEAGKAGADAGEAAQANLAKVNSAITAYTTAVKGSADQHAKLMAIIKLIGGGLMVAGGAVASVTGVGAVVGAPLIAGGIGVAASGGVDLANQK